MTPCKASVYMTPLSPDQNRRAVQRHEQRNDRAGKDLDGTAAITATQQFGEGVRVKAMSQSAGWFTQEDKRDQDSNKDVAKSQPQ